MGRFLRLLLVLTFLMHLPVVAAIARAAMLANVPHPWVVGVVWGAAGMALFLGRARAAMPDRRRSGALVWLVDVPYFVHWCACVFTLFPALGATIVGPIVRLARGEAFALPIDFYAWTYALGLVVAAYGILVRRRWFYVREVEIAIDGLDARFDGYRIAHLSDLHIGSTTPRAWGERWSNAANARSPDLSWSPATWSRAAPTSTRTSPRSSGRSARRTASSCRWATTTTSARAS